MKRFWKLMGLGAFSLYFLGCSAEVPPPKADCGPLKGMSSAMCSYRYGTAPPKLATMLCYNLQVWPNTSGGCEVTCNVGGKVADPTLADTQCNPTVINVDAANQVIHWTCDRGDSLECSAEMPKSPAAPEEPTAAQPDPTNAGNTP